MQCIFSLSITIENETKNQDKGLGYQNHQTLLKDLLSNCIHYTVAQEMRDGLEGMRDDPQDWNLSTGFNCGDNRRRMLLD